jgi:DNA-binding LacI/PurR family transcriptional regulator
MAMDRARGETRARADSARPTLEEVAALAGVSTATVSRVLNNSTPVSEGARASVERAVAELGYVPNPAARSLARRRTDTIALVVSEPDELAFADPFYPAIVHGIGEAIADTDLQLILLLAQGSRAREKVERYVLQGHVDGVVMLCQHGDDALPRAFVAADVPIVMTGRPRDTLTVPFVDADNRDGARAATEHLLRTRRRVATITGPLDLTVTADRFEGYRDAVAAAGLAFDPDLVAAGDFTAESGGRAMEELLEHAPDVDGVFAASDVMAVGALRYLAAAGRRVPDDIAVIGFDDIAAAATSTPPLTTMRQPFAAMTEALTDLLRRRITGAAAPDERIVFATELIRRASA